MALIQGDKLGSCEILGLLGKGGMGEVYRGRDARLGREVAVKALPDLFASDPDRVARFEREAQTLASLNHPNIAAIYEFKESGGSQYLILELVDGETLAERLARGAMLLDEALPAALQIAGALEAAHEKGIVHRDLKPANVKITHEGRVKVLDFGLAKAMESSDGAVQTAGFSNSPTLLTAHTAGAMILGTAGYMSPEQARGKAVDRRSDVWGFGCVLYEMLSGRPAFPNGESPSDTIAGVLTRDPDWSALPSTTPSKIRGLIERCLRKDVRRRLRDIGDARIEIEDILHGSDVAPIAAQSSGKGRSRERSWAVLAVIFFIAAAAALIGPMVNAPPPPRPAPPIRLDVIPPERAGYVHLSPDGKKLAFSTPQRGNRKTFIWIRPLDSTDADAYPLASTEGAAPVFFWSPDSQFIGFWTQGKLKKAALSGGPAVTLTEFLASSGGRTGTWNAEGVILLQGSATDGKAEILRVAADGGTAIPETELDRGKNEILHLWPNFLPDGKHYFFLIRTEDPRYSLSYVGTLGSKERIPLPGIASEVKYSATGHILFVKDSALMAQPFDAAQLKLSGEATIITDPITTTNVREGGGAAFSTALTGAIAYKVPPLGASELTWFDRNGNPVGVAGPKGDYVMPELSADGKYVAFFRDTGIWALDVATGKTSPLTSHSGDTQPQWSPTGKSVVFSGTRNNVAGVYERAFGVIGEDKLLLNGRISNLSQWAPPDGRYLVHYDASDISAVSLSGERNPLNLTETPVINEGVGKVSPDGHWIAYQSNATGAFEIYIQSFPELGRKQQVTSSGGFQPRWNPNGKELFYVATDSSLMSVSTAPAGESLTVGSPVKLSVLPVRPNTRGNYNVSSDGRFLVQVSSEEGLTSPITVIVNWVPGLK